MTRPSVYITIAFISMNVLAGIMGATGVSAHLGVDHNVGSDDTVDSISQNASSTSSASGAGESLLALYHSTATGLTGILNILPALAMLRRVGVPGAWVGAFVQICTVIIGIDVVAFLKGYNL